MGSKALRADVQRVFGEQVEVQRCQIHKQRNVQEYLPESCQKDYDRRMRHAYPMNNYAEARRATMPDAAALPWSAPSGSRQNNCLGDETSHAVIPTCAVVMTRKLE
jgi:putative transposase